MNQLNYNHLRYFWAVAHEGNLTRTAERLNVSQSALSIQIKKLEAQVGHALLSKTSMLLCSHQKQKTCPHDPTTGLHTISRHTGHFQSSILGAVVLAIAPRNENIVDKTAN